jgi:hypothetical protein
MLLGSVASCTSTTSADIEWLIESDFSTGIYAIGGESAVLADVWAEDEDFGTFNAGMVQAAIGLVHTAGTVSPVLTGDALSAIVAAGGFTALAEFNFVEDGASQARIELSVQDLPVFNQQYLAQVVSEALGGADGAILTPDPSGVIPKVTQGVHTVAITMDDAHVAVSVDGGTVVSVSEASERIWDSVGLLIFEGILTKINFTTPVDDAALPSIAF